MIEALIRLVFEKMIKDGEMQYTLKSIFYLQNYTTFLPLIRVIKFPLTLHRYFVEKLLPKLFNVNKD